MSLEKFSVEKILLNNEIHCDKSVTVNNGIITAIENNTGTSQGNISGTLVPGFIDLQVNGGGGKLFNHSPDLQTIIKIGQAHQSFGTTGWFPTLVTDSVEIMNLAADSVAQAISESIPGVLGIHFEGPHLSLDKKGVHSEHLIRKIGQAEMDIFLRQDIGKVMVTLAPEQVDTQSIKSLSEAGVVVCLGHSNASFEQTNHAIAAGAMGFTHLFNAMSQFGSREAGMVGAALANKNCYYGLILDGVHVHPESAKLAFNANKKLILVTDAMPPVGCDKSSFEFFGQSIKCIDNSLRDNEGRLAGSILDMATAVKNSQEMLGLEFSEAIKLATHNPACFLKLEQSYGSLAVGKKASMLILNEQGKVTKSWIDGNLVFS